MAEIQNVFVNGKMNSDIHNSLTDGKGYVLAENLRITGNGNDGSFNFVKGSLLLSNTFNEVGDVIVGAFEGADNKNYFLLAMPNGKSKIIEYDVITNISKLIINDLSILRFDKVRWSNGNEIKPFNYILNINQIGQYLIISGEWWECPFSIDLKRDYSLGYTIDDILLSKKPPFHAPEIIEKVVKLDNDNNSDSDKFVSFSYRYKYLDNSYSSLSFYSDTAFDLKSNDFKINSYRENKSAVNKYKSVKLSINSGGINVKGIDVFAREHGSNTAYLIYTIDKEKAGIQNDILINNIEYKFSNNYEILDENSTNMLYSNVPKFPKTQTVIGNRLLFGNYKESFDVPQTDFEILLSSIKSSDNKKTAVSMFNYKAGIVYLNDYNESTSVLLPTNQSKAEVFIPFNKRNFQNRLSIKLTSQPPSWATKIKVVVKHDVLDYDNIFFTDAKRKAKKVYLYLNGENVNKVKKGDTIYFTQNEVEDYIEYVISDILLLRVEDDMPREGYYAIVEDDENKIPIIKNAGDEHEYLGGRKIKLFNIDGTETTKYYDVPFYFHGDMPIEAVSDPPLVYVINSHGSFNYGQISMGDEVYIEFSIQFIRSLNSGTDYLTDNVILKKETIFSESEYPSMAMFLYENISDERFTVNPYGDSVYLITNYEFQKYLENHHPVLINYENSTGKRITAMAKLSISIKRGMVGGFARTKNTDNLNPFYFETQKTFPIVNGKIMDAQEDINGNLILQTGFYNGFSFGNGVETYRIKDGFNKKALKHNFRGNVFDKNGYKRLHRKNDLTYSSLFNDELSINGLSEFNPILANWKSLPINYGSIQRIISTDGDVSVFCTDKVIQQLYGKSVLMDLTGNENVGISNEVLGDYRVLPYEFGISNNPESIAKYSNMIFFTDKHRGRFLMKVGSEIMELNSVESGFYNEGIELLKTTTSLLGSFNEKNNEYFIGLDNKKVVAYSLYSKGFTSYYNYNFDYIIGAYGRHYSTNKGLVYLDEATENYNSFAGQDMIKAVIKYIVNPKFNNDFIYKAIMLQSNEAWDVDIETNLTKTKFGEMSFVKKESFFHSDIHRDNSGFFAIKGIGQIININGNKLSFNNNIDPEISIDDVLLDENLQTIGTITNIQDNNIYISTTPTILNGDYVLAKKQNDGVLYPDSSPMRGQWMSVTLSKKSNKNIFITSTKTEVIESKL